MPADAERDSKEVARCYPKTMTYRVALRKTDEGFSVSCPALPGCWSQGVTEPEALDNIRSAIQEYLAARDEIVSDAEIRQVEVTLDVWASCLEFLISRLFGHLKNQAFGSFARANTS